eukprot:CAMPEP_0182568492 /NCGR_PEP_ID=MMETSP1324-20130603/9422_1 /TAXON_ID=236786 /ORGANISM="Florenciella sp., Strain RCC1587" /LENGTH=73 /DNA_ID=CAMNT_0024782645 /DNA_START=340 /DNA_END=561 /DNA_ORIENTATION=+
MAALRAPGPPLPPPPARRAAACTPAPVPASQRSAVTCLRPPFLAMVRLMAVHPRAGEEPPHLEHDAGGTYQRW